MIQKLRSTHVYSMLKYLSSNKVEKPSLDSFLHIGLLGILSFGLLGIMFGR